MADRTRNWRASTPKRAKPKVPPAIKAEVERRGNERVEAVIKPKHIKPPPDDTDFNYLVDIYTKWGLDHGIGHFRPPQTITACVCRWNNQISNYLSNSCKLIGF